MFRLSSLALAALPLCAAQLFGADDPFLGTWTLNSEKSVFEVSSSLPMNVALKIKPGKYGALVISMTGFPHAQPLDLENIDGYDRCNDEEHIVNFGRFGFSGWPEAAMIPAAVRAIACVRFNGNHRALSTTVRQNGKLIASSWRSVSDDGRFLTEIRTGLDKRSGYYYRSVLVWDKKLAD